MQTISALTESQILNLILPILEGGSGGWGSSAVPGAGEIGPGDDAAYVVPRSARGFLVSVDAVVEGQDFLWTWPNGHEHRAEDIGYKSIAQNLSDINAMGGTACHVFVSLQCPRTTPLERLLRVAQGMRSALDELAPECRVSGGDLGVAAEFASTVTVMGEPAGVLPVRRSGATAGDTLAVAGRLGWAAAGLDLLLDPAASSSLPKPCSTEGEPGEREQSSGGHGLQELIRAQTRPTPPMEAGPRAAAAGATSMLDVSDGLVRDAYRLARASGVRLDLDLAALTELGALIPGGVSDPLRLVLTGGEDFALLATFPSESLPEGFARIGTVLAAEKDGADPAPSVSLDGRVFAESGFDHFG